MRKTSRDGKCQIVGKKNNIIAAYIGCLMYRYGPFLIKIDPSATSGTILNLLFLPTQIAHRPIPIAEHWINIWSRCSNEFVRQSNITIQMN